MTKRNIRLLVIDVDGTMTDGGIYYDDNNNELKKFCTKDAAGFFAAHAVGIKIMVLTGRECAATTRRMRELQVDILEQNIKNKREYLEAYMIKEGLTREQVGYIGDDLNDYAPMQMVGFVGCPADSCEEIKQIAHYISPIRGGFGAVRDVVEYILRQSGEWERAISAFYDMGI